MALHTLNSSMVGGGLPAGGGDVGEEQAGFRLTQAADCTKLTIIRSDP